MLLLESTVEWKKSCVVVTGNVLFYVQIHLCSFMFMFKFIYKSDITEGAVARHHIII